MVNKQTGTRTDKCVRSRLTYGRKIYVFCSSVAYFFKVTLKELYLQMRVRNQKSCFPLRTHLPNSTTNKLVTSTLFIVIATTQNKKSTSAQRSYFIASLAQTFSKWRKILTPRTFLGAITNKLLITSQYFIPNGVK